MAKRTATFDGCTYRVRSDRIEIPDLEAMPRIEALVWINQNTYRRGYSQPPSPLAGLGDVLAVRVG